MALTEKVTFLLGADARGVVKEFDKVGRAADKSLGKAENRIDRLGATFTKVGAGMLGAAGLAGAALASTIGPASDLNEAINVVGLTFGDSAADIEEWGESAATALGQSKRSALEGAAAIGGLLQNVGFLEGESADLSKKLVTLASDMGSAFNTDPADALAALRSGLAGESEPLKKYNVFINEAAIKTKAFSLGLGDSSGALSDNEKAQARYAIIMEQTSKIQGDFAATSDGAANAQRIMAAQLEDTRAAIGQAVLPIFEQLIGVTNNVLGAFNGLSEGQKRMVSQFAVLGTGLLGGLGAFTLVVGKAIEMRKRFNELSTTMRRSAIAAGVMFAAFIAGQQVLQLFKAQADKVEESVQKFVSAFEAAGDPTEALKTVLGGIIKEGGKAGDALGSLSRGEMALFISQMVKGEASVDEMAAGLEQAGVDAFTAETIVKGLAASFREATERTDNLNSALGTGSVVSDRLAGSWQNVVGQVREGIDPTARIADEIGKAGENADGAEDPLKDLALAFGEANAKADPFADALDRVNSGLDDFFGSLIDPIEAQVAFERAIDKAADAVKEHGSSLDEDTKAGQDNLDNRNDIIGAIEDQVASMIEQRKTSEEIRAEVERMIARVKEEQIERGIAQVAVDEYAAAFDQIPGEVVTRLTAEGYDENLILFGNIKAAIDEIPKEVTVRLNTLGELGGVLPPNAEIFPSNRATAPDPNVITNFSLVPTLTEGSAGAAVKAGSSSGGGLTRIEVPLTLNGRELTRAVAEYSAGSGGAPIKVRGSR